jgi:hypothetical protein
MKEELKEELLEFLGLFTVGAILVLLFVIFPAVMIDRLSCYTGLENMQREGYWELPGLCMVEIDEKYYPSTMIRKEIDKVNIND